MYPKLSIAGNEERPIAIIGMPVSGKTTLGSRLGMAMGRKHFDVDDLIKEHYGSPHTIVAEHNWETYRSIEACVALEHLYPGLVTSMSSGIVESPSVVDALREQSMNVWIQSDCETVIDRLWETRGHMYESLHDLTDHVRTAFEEREDVFAALAHVVVSGRETTTNQIRQILRFLRGDGDLAKSA